MYKKILMVSNADVDGSLVGVKEDIENYTEFFISPEGGAWLESEIDYLSRPSWEEFHEKVSEMDELDYSVIIFSGHGGLDRRNHETFFWLNDDETVDLCELGGTWRTVIADSCRSVQDRPRRLRKGSVVEESMQDIFMYARKFYENNLQLAMKKLPRPEATVYMYACSPGQVARGTYQGGIYSRTLLDCARKWAQASKINDCVLDVSSAQLLARNAMLQFTQRLVGQQQIPDIDMPRITPLYPFAINVKTLLS